MKNAFVILFGAWLSLTLLPSTARAQSDSFIEKCPDIQTCAKAVAELTGQKYVFDQDLKGHGGATANVKFDKDTAEQLFTQLLNSEGYTRAPLKMANTYQILRQRDARDQPLPVVKADKTSAPSLPDTWDLYTMVYKASHSEAVEEIARNSRSFMPAYSRIIAVELSGSVVVTDSAPNLKKLYELIRDMDEKPTAEMLKRWEAREKERREERRNLSQQPNPGGGPRPRAPAAPGEPPAKPKTK